ncbi:Glycosyl hydrolase family 115 [Tangfeifania diversioriginum]|uniref:Glycosyl hydrolase family 115 n=1 Tax=Tangfeifania diversioriginum TaxID=1168035 RepID=A0A1M6BUZ1_9BACT|nr:glycosyl hydrolase 115 family protein [Tangfeifania diversioriginum]SHI52318.1 Glycosyl hydrolase family 115 [Tangfeifania diversioriginum]
MTKNKFKFILFCSLFALSLFPIFKGVAGNGNENLLPVAYLTNHPSPDDFTLVSSGKTAPLVLDGYEYPGVIKVAGMLQNDIYKVTGTKPRVILDQFPQGQQAVIIGTIGQSKLIDGLVESGKISVDDIKGKWETSLIQVVENPFPNVPKALVIAGSDKRGTIYGMFDLSRQMGMSPWHFWSDVPPKSKSQLFVKNGRYNLGTPKVKYRGIFLNDEEPALGRWAVENYGGFNHLFYEKVFELILRMKGNYLWPAMWWAGFYSDDPQNAELAHELGIVMGTTHHEPMMRAHAEWKAGGEGDWNYETNEEILKEFWRGGIERMDDRESIVTLAMRGDGDMAMTDETNIELLERIVADQRKIIEDVTGEDAAETPQLWALYKEVQDYYDQGMRVPDDVTLLLCDDNWGNIRKLPKPDAPPREGGYGIYYHFDYVGGPRNYKWLNTSPLPRVWEQMNLAYRHGVDRIWIVNVGDLKPMELPISFFLDFAFDPDAWPAERLNEYTELWAKEQFGSEHSTEIAEMLRLYTKFNGRRKPELLSPETYSLIHFNEAERVRSDYNQLAERAKKLYEKIPAEDKDAFYQLVLHPIIACANLNDLYVTTAQNRLYASQGRALTNQMASRVEKLFEKDAEITDYYHTELANGKWNHMMAQTHIGYTYWQQPPENSMPEVETISVPEKAEMGVAIEGSEKFWTSGVADVSLPEISTVCENSVYIEIFNRGKVPFSYRVETGEEWLTFHPASGTVDDEVRLWASVNRDLVPAGYHSVPVKISGNGQTVTVNARVFKTTVYESQLAGTFPECKGYVSMEAEHFNRKVETENITWKVISGLGRTLGGVTVKPVTAERIKPEGDSPRLEYDIFLFEPGEIELNVLLSPTLNYYTNDETRKIAVSVDDEEPQIINLHENETLQDWERWVSNNSIETSTKHNIHEPGKHTVKIWMVDAGLVIQKVVIRSGEKGPTYLKLFL